MIEFLFGIIYWLGRWVAEKYRSWETSTDGISGWYTTPLFHTSPQKKMAPIFSPLDIVAMPHNSEKPNIDADATEAFFNDYVTLATADTENTPQNTYHKKSFPGFTYAKNNKL